MNHYTQQILDTLTVYLKQNPDIPFMKALDELNIIDRCSIWKDKFTEESHQTYEKIDFDKIKFTEGPFYEQIPIHTEDILNEDCNDTDELIDELSSWLERGSYHINYRGKQYTFDVEGLGSYVEYGIEEVGVKNFKEVI